MIAIFSCKLKFANHGVFSTVSNFINVCNCSASLRFKSSQTGNNENKILAKDNESIIFFCIIDHKFL